MQATFFQSFALSALAVFLSTTMAVGSAGGGSFTRGCAGRDLQILMMIEAREYADAVHTKKLNDALLAMMHARIVCHEGYVVDALALYELIDQSVRSIPVLSEYIE